MKYLLHVPIAVSLSIGALGGCGGGSSNSPMSPTSPSPVPTTRTVVLQGAQQIPVDYHYEFWFTTVRSGTLDITVDWTFADSVVWVRLGQGTCTEAQIQAGQCQWILQSLVSQPKPRALTLPAAAAGQYTLFIYNGGPQPESVSFLVELTG